MALERAFGMSVDVVGIFVGGKSRRMGGFPKGLLILECGESILERTIRLAETIADDVVLVGARKEYESLGCPMIADARSDVGPLGGLVALLERAHHGVAIGIACDMPYLTRAMLSKLADSGAGACPIVAPREAGRWSALFARYDSERVLPFARARLAASDTSMQALFNEVGAAELAFDDEERRALYDWDTPDDMSGARAARADEGGRPRS
jgi:molybdopterin-guanine dinucleotide biosynthesis protein A